MPNKLPKSITLEPLPFEEAIEFFADLHPITPGEYAALSKAAQAQAFTVSRVTGMDVIMDMHKAIEKAIAEGETLAMFQGRMKDIMAARGWEGLTPWHLDTIFRNNVQTAYNVGRYRQMIDMEDRFPYWEYDAVNDSRTRPPHASLDGKIYASNHPFWDTWYPPNGHKCRCGANPVHKYIVEEEGLKIETEYPIDIAPDPGWDHNPAKEPWEPDLSKYPPELVDQYEGERDRR